MLLVLLFLVVFALADSTLRRAAGVAIAVASGAFAIFEPGFISILALIYILGGLFGWFSSSLYSIFGQPPLPNTSNDAIEGGK